jgi:nucleoside 2-deoxyribosyltransferase
MIYIASPFFNPPQLQVVMDIEEVLDAAEVSYYSPRKEGVLKPDAGPDERRQIFASNVDNIQSNCTLMIAVTHYAMPSGITLQVCKRGDVTAGWAPEPFLELNQPDTGTTFEIGAAYAAGIPLIAYHPASQDKLNIMLANAFGGFAFTMHQLRQAIWHCHDVAVWGTDSLSHKRKIKHEAVAYCLDEGVLSPWEGKVQ